MRTIIYIIIVFLSVVFVHAERPESKRTLSTHPVFKVNFIHPTADKPQSKLWFSDGCWWTILPDSAGPTLWQRTGKGWKEHPGLRTKLNGVPGRSDVWPEKDQVMAVGVGDSSLTVFRILKQPGGSPVQWEPERLANLYPPAPSAVETATLAKDGAGNWWVAATAGLKVCVWFSSNGGKIWSKPTVLAEGIDEDDICVITPLKNAVGVIWSDQVRDAILIREHQDGKSAVEWEKEIIIDAGNKTADDHLNTVLTPDGTLWMATKNSVDKTGQPQFVLRIRSVDGKWTNRPYLVLENRMKRPSRPIVVAAEDNSYIFLGHGDNDRSVPYPYNSNITFALADTSLSSVWAKSEIVIAPDHIYKNVVHNVTGPKFPFPINAPWIILASDAEGRVYEADLKKMVKK